LGARPLVERSGHAFIRNRMQQSKAPFGAEISGHYFFGELDGGDDGLVAACRMIAFLARGEKKLFEVRRGCPNVFTTPDLRVALEAAAQREALDRVQSAWANCPQQTLDGVRVDMPNGWALVRPSVTESALTFRFESGDWQELEELVGQFCNTLGDVGDRLWTTYEAAIGRRDPGSCGPY